MTLPNFFLIGAGKSGTTSLAWQLGQHPEIFMSDPKEPHFFSINQDRGEDWYRGLFSRAGQAVAVGEASATYSLSPEYAGVPERIAGMLGKELKFIYIVRNPVDRMLSHCRHDKLAGLVPAGRPYAEMLGEDEKYFQGSCYAAQLELYHAVFGAAATRVVLFEEYVRDPEATLRMLFGFLGVDPDFAVTDMQARNVSEVARRVPGVVRVLYRLRDLPVAGTLLQSLSRRLGIRKLVDRVTGRAIEAPRLTDAEYRSCYERFLPDIRRLSDMTGLDPEALWLPDRARQVRT